MITKRLFDLTVTVALFILCIIPCVVISLILFASRSGPILHWSKRAGMNDKPFHMPKFRTMKIDAPEIETALLVNPEAYITPFGSFLRKTSLDEIPQLFSVFKGDMSLVGPRPALISQEDLISQRRLRNINKFRPGITGLAQVYGRDYINDQEKVFFDEKYCNNFSLIFDIKILFLTAFVVFFRKNISH